MRRSSLVAVMVVLLTSASCGSDTGAGDPVPEGSGIRGVVVVGPQCPVAVEGSPCPDRPWQGTVRVSDEGGQVMEALTDAKGRFTVAVSPGPYDVTPIVEGSGPGFAGTERVTVTDGAFTVVTLTVDSGIR